MTAIKRRSRFHLFGVSATCRMPCQPINRHALRVVGSATVKNGSGAGAGIDLGAGTAKLAVGVGDTIATGSGADPDSCLGSETFPLWSPKRIQKRLKPLP